MLKIVHEEPVKINTILDFTNAGTDSNVIPAKLEDGKVSIYVRTTDDDKVVELRMSSSMAAVIHRNLARVLGK